MPQRAPTPPVRDTPSLAWNVFSDDVSLAAVEVRERYGHRVRLPGLLPGAGGSVQLFTHPDDAQVILQQKPSKFTGMKAPGSNDFERATRNSIVSLREDSEYGSWSDRVRILSPDFKRETAEKREMELVRAIQASLSGLSEFELLDAMRRITIRLMGVSLFGPDIRSFEDDIIEAIDELRAAFKQRHMRLSSNLPSRGNVDPEKSLQKLENVAERLVYRRHRTPHLYDDAIVRWLDELPMEVVEREVVGMLIAGFTTLSAGLTWCVHEVSKSPTLQSKIRESVLYDGSVHPTSDLVGSVWKEALRLYSPLPILGRQADEDVVVNGFKVYEGETVLLSPFVTHRDPEFWDAPDSFRPRRFIDAPVPSKEFAYFPFGSGPHACLGEAMADTEAKALISTLFSLYHVEHVSGDPTVDTAINLQPSEDITVRLIER